MKNRNKKKILIGLTTLLIVGGSMVAHADFSLPPQTTNLAIYTENPFLNDLVKKKVLTKEEAQVLFDAEAKDYVLTSQMDKINQQAELDANALYDANDKLYETLSELTDEQSVKKINEQINENTMKANEVYAQAKTANDKIIKDIDDIYQPIKDIVIKAYGPLAFQGN